MPTLTLARAQDRARSPDVVFSQACDDRHRREAIITSAKHRRLATSSHAFLSRIGVTVAISITGLDVGLIAHLHRERRLRVRLSRSCRCSVIVNMNTSIYAGAVRRGGCALPE
jgi:hypothetical protein